jgi:hypothetical protein
MQLSKEERLDLNLLALAENEKSLHYARRLIKKFMEPQIDEDALWVQANIIIETKNAKQESLLKIRELILNEK